MKNSTTPLITLLLVSGSIFASCTVDKKNLSFDDDAYDKAKNPSGGDEGDGGKGGSSGSGDGDSGNQGGAPSSGGMSGSGGAMVVEPDCTMTGELKCDGKQIQVCTGEFFIDAGKPCEFLCSDGECSGSCAPGLTECVSETEQRSCDTEGQWGEASQCKNVCIGKACGGVCSPGDRSCDEDDSSLKLLCGAEGQWEPDGNCSVGACSAGACTSCSGTETQCTADSKAVQTCESNAWSTPVDCRDQVCIGGACTGECRPALDGDLAQRKCVPGTPSIQLETCGADGAFGGAINCSYVCIPGNDPGKNDQCGGVCKPGAQRCDGGTLYECSADGLQEEKMVDCESEGLKCLDVGGGKLGCGECTPSKNIEDNNRCVQRIVETCSEGFWKKSENCEDPLIPRGEVAVCYQGACTTGNVACKDSSGRAYGCYDSSQKWVCDEKAESGIANLSCFKSECSLSTCPTLELF